MNSNIGGSNARRTAYRARKAEYAQAVDNVMSHLLIMPEKLDGVSMTVGTAISKTGTSRIYAHCAAAYLNAYFELYAG
eukprot:CAMPEP_0184459356 /NCGR_PEP_ID=MMETSP0740-20130409/36639_1 /TAXON_ID=385413 /ORGANISM="Thalassiosira miniscula, Strain CCMP1093" /LENGTH=77 /DNA_ID=CAMNT_0026832333 /DNA_START=19 /DNA_END=248 /DNA_ORIENTATION=+